MGKSEIKEYVLITEDYPIHIDFNFVPKQARLILITKIVHNELTPPQKKAFDKIVVLDEFDFDAVLKAIKNNVTDYEKTCLLANDDTIFPMVARVRETWQIPGPQVHTILPFCDKVESKRRLQGSKVNYPQFIAFDHSSYKIDPKQYLDKIKEQLKFPIIVKPTNLAGALEVRKIATPQALQAWCKKHVPSEWQETYGRKIDFELEEFVATSNADLFHCDAIIKGGKVIFTQISRLTYPCMEVIQGKPIGSIVLAPNEKGYKQLSELPALVIQAFRRYAAIPDGVMHLEAFYDNASGQATFIETQLRYPGGDARSAYEYYLKMDLEEIHFKLQMGLPLDSLPAKKGPYAAWVYLPTKDGVIDELILPKIKSKIYKMQYFVQSAQKTQLPSSLFMSG